MRHKDITAQTDLPMKRPVFFLTAPRTLLPC